MVSPCNLFFKINDKAICESYFVKKAFVFWVIKAQLRTFLNENVLVFISNRTWIDVEILSKSSEFPNYHRKWQNVGFKKEYYGMWLLHYYLRRYLVRVSWCLLVHLNPPSCCDYFYLVRSWFLCLGLRKLLILKNREFDC